MRWAIARKLTVRYCRSSSRFNLARWCWQNLLGNNTPLKLPAMLVKIKTPELPLHLAGEPQRQDLRWQINTERRGMVARGVDDADQLRAFVVSEDRMKEAFGLLKTLSM